MGSSILTSLLLTSVSYAANDVDSIDIEGTSRVDDLPQFTNAIATIAELAEDWIFPCLALIIAAVSMYRLWSARDWSGAVIGIIAAIGLASMPMVMQTLSAFGTAS